MKTEALAKKGHTDQRKIIWIQRLIFKLLAKVHFSINNNIQDKN